MAILKMKKLSLITPRDSAQKLLKDLMWLDCVEIIPQEASQQVLQFMPTTPPAQINGRLEKIASALGAIGKYRKKKGLFGSGDELSREDFDGISKRADEIYGVVNGILSTKDEQNKTLNKINSLKSKISQLEPWSESDLPLNKTSTEQVSIICGTLPLSCTLESLEEFEQSERFFIEQVSQDREQRYICVYCFRRESDQIQRLLSGVNFSKTVFTDTDGTPKEIITRLKTEISGLEKQLEQLEDELKKYAERADELESLYDYENSELNICNSLCCSTSTETTAVIQGWIPEEKLSKLEKKLKNYVCFYELSDPEEGEKPPITLKNNWFASAFEGLIELYSYPDYYGYDPLKYMSIFYCVIFGIMLSDFVYGMLLTIGCLAAIKLMKPKKTMRTFLEMFAWSGVSTAISGLLFGSILGDLPSSFNQNMLGGTAFSTAIWFDPTKNPMSLLYVSFALGGLHLLWGMGIKAYMLFKRGKWLDAVCDIFTWYLLFAGIGVLAAGALLSKSMVLEVGKWMSIAGVASLILTQGRTEKNIIMKLLKGIMSLYDIVNYVSDLLSYSRILALGLATAVVSSVINIMATLAGPTVFGYILFPIILVVGHALNIALNVLGSFVHASRLQYIEFFGKFYEDGGRHFAPLHVDAKYTRINVTEEN